VQGLLVNPGRASRVVCYCHDCQAFAHFLGQADRVLDPSGGSDVFQVLPRNLNFTQGAEALSCVRLTGRGMLRWYAGCCCTPIGNTLSSPRLSFIGVIRPFIALADPALDEVFGPVRARVHTAGATGGARLTDTGRGRVAAWFLRTIIRARFNGDHRHTPFFHPDTGAPVVTPWVLSGDEHARVMDAVRQGG
jgi:hypothetical protein